MPTNRTHELRDRRHRRVRKKVVGTTERPRLAVFRSNRHIVAEAALRSKSTGKAGAAAEVGRLVAERARSKGVSKVVFDRGGSLYHGRVAALADAAREAGLEL